MLMMLPFEAPTIFEGIHKSYFRMPRVVKDQRGRFENDDLFRQLSHESAVKYTGFKDRPLAERQGQFINDCYLGHTEVSVVQSGNQFTLMFTPTANPAYDHEGCYIDKEQNKAHIKAGFILNGVCVLWRGWIDLQRLEGFGCLEFDEYRAYLEDAMAKQQSDGKQPMCNNNLNAQAAPTPPQLGGRLNHHLGGPAPPSSVGHAAVATSNALLPPAPPSVVGLNSSCLSAGATNSSPLANSSSNLAAPAAPAQQPPAVSLAESAAAHYGSAAIAAAAAAAFHQALSVPQSLSGLHGLGMGVPAPHSLVSQHLAYTASQQQQLNMTSSSPSSSLSPPHHHTSPQHLFLNNSAPPPSLPTNTSNGHNQKSPERENINLSASQQQAHKASPKRPSKRHHEELGQTDEVDVVSDISAHDLDFPPRRIFKSAPTESPIASHNSNNHHHHHHNHHHHPHHHQQHKISRRAA